MPATKSPLMSHKYFQVLVATVLPWHLIWTKGADVISTSTALWIEHAFQMKEIFCYGQKYAKLWYALHYFHSNLLIYDDQFSDSIFLRSRWSCVQKDWLSTWFFSTMSVWEATHRAEWFRWITKLPIKNPLCISIINLIQLTPHQDQ